MKTIGIFLGVLVGNLLAELIRSQASGKWPADGWGVRLAISIPLGVLLSVV